MTDKTEFNDFTVSTKTFIARTNLNINIREIFERKIIPVFPYIVIKKKRGRKKKVQEEDPNQKLDDGSFIRVQYMDRHYGVVLKEKQQGFFRNSMTMVIIIDNKRLNFKITENGKFQITGCKTEDQAEKCVLYFWKHIKKCVDLYVFSKGEDLLVYYEPVMSNIDFFIGFPIIKENLDTYINNHTEYNSLLETTLGYTGVNIKFPVPDTFENLLITYKTYGKNSKTDTIPYDEFIINENSKIPKWNTFLVFQSGKVIMSGKDKILMKESYLKFVEIIQQCKDVIMDKNV